MGDTPEKEFVSSRGPHFCGTSIKIVPSVLVLSTAWIKAIQGYYTALAEGQPVISFPMSATPPRQVFPLGSHFSHMKEMLVPSMRKVLTENSFGIVILPLVALNGRNIFVLLQ
jgi:hypothetical protein